MRRLFTDSFVLTVASLCLPAMAQECPIKGSITNSRHASIANAIVTVTHVETGWTRQVLASARGHFQLAQVPQGEYRIEALKPGFKPLVITGGAQCAAVAAALDLQMEEADVSETVALQAKKAGDGSLLTYICGLARGSGCEMLEPGAADSLPDMTVVSSILP